MTNERSEELRGTEGCSKELGEALRLLELFASDCFEQHEGYGNYFCIHCYGDDVSTVNNRIDIEHTDDCIVTKAWELLNNP